MVALAGLYAPDAAAGDVDETHAMLENFQAETGLLASATYDGDKPLSLSLTPGDYADFLRAMANNELLTVDETAQMEADQIGDRDIAQSPGDSFDDGRWRYGFGNWVQCELDEPACRTLHHSASARGFFPWLERSNNTFGVIAHDTGSPLDSYTLYEAIAGDIAIVFAD
jgi:hypothetical protein